MNETLIEPDDLDDLTARLWTHSGTGRECVRALLASIETVAPAVIDQAHARRVARQPGLTKSRAG